MQSIAIDDQPQFFVDDYLVDNRWGVEYLTEAVIRVFHAPVKEPANPVIAGCGGYVAQLFFVDRHRDLFAVEIDGRVASTERDRIDRDVVLSCLLRCFQRVDTGDRVAV